MELTILLAMKVYLKAGVVEQTLHLGEAETPWVKNLAEAVEEALGLRSERAIITHR